LEIKVSWRIRLTSPPSVRLVSRKVWKPRRLTTLWASMACYRDRCTFDLTNVRKIIPKKAGFAALILERMSVSLTASVI
jgi:hypothetical protein